MLATRYRLKGKKNFDRLKKVGKLYQMENFGIAVADQEQVSDSRFAFIISTKISKLAVHRNRIVRAMSEAVRRNIEFVPKGKDIGFLAKKGIVGKTTEEIMREVENFLKAKKI